MKKVTNLVGMFLSLLLVRHAYGIGTGALGNEVASANSLGQGGVGVARPLGPESVYYNPAAITELSGMQVTVGGTFEDTHISHETSSGGSSENIRPLSSGIPNLAFTSSGWLNNKLSLGIAIESPYGSDTHWSETGFSRYLSTNARFRMFIVNPALAYKVAPGISMAVGGDYIDLSDVTQERYINGSVMESTLAGTPTLAADPYLRQQANGNNWSWNTGVYFHPDAYPKNSVGLTYRPKVKITARGGVDITGISGPLSQFVFGGANYQTAAYTDVFLPQNVSLGYAYRATDSLTFEADWAWYDWAGAMQDTDIRYSATGTQLALLSTGDPIRRDWRDTNNFAIGADYKVTSSLVLRTGYYYIPWVVPDASFDPSLPDLTRHGLTIGAGYTIGRVTLDLAYNAIFFESRSITNSVATSTVGTAGIADASGKYSNFVNLLSMNITYRF